MSLALIKKTDAFARLKKDIISNNLTHAYIFVSDDKIARQELFDLIAINILCEKACGVCRLCGSIIDKEYIDIMQLDCDNRVKVSDIEALVENTSINPTVGKKKLYYIESAHKLSPQAQNKLLKTLEEPPEFAIIFLGVNNESGLLSTIKSRAKKIYVDNFATSDIEAQLIKNQVDPYIAQVSAAYSLGNLTKAYEFAENEDYVEIYNQCFELLLTLKNSTQIVEFLYRPIFSKGNIALTLDFIEIILGDVLKLTTKSKVALSTNQRDYDLKTITKSFNHRSAYMSIQIINECRKKLNSNINLVSVTEGLLFGILEAKYKWQQ